MIHERNYRDRFENVTAMEKDSQEITEQLDGQCMKEIAGFP